jgi:hypothetical protein
LDLFILKELEVIWESGKCDTGFGASELRSFGASELRSFGASELRSFGASELRSFDKTAKLENSTEGLACQEDYHFCIKAPGIKDLVIDGNRPASEGDELERDRRRKGAEWDEYRLWGIPWVGRGV